MVNLIRILDGKEKVSKKDRAYRDDATKRRVCLIWEAIRRTPKYKFLYAKYYSGNETVEGEIFGIYNILPPIDPTLSYSKVSIEDLRQAFNDSCIAFPLLKHFMKQNDPKNPVVDLALRVDLTYRDSVIFNELHGIIHRQKACLKRLGVKIERPLPRQGAGQYNLNDFVIYDLCKKQKHVCFKRIIEGQLAHFPKPHMPRTHAGKIRSEFINKYANQLQRRYKRAEDLIGGKFEHLVHSTKWKF